MKTDTIAAIATAMANSGIGIVRISGEEAFSVIDKIYHPKKGNKILSQAASHTVHYGYIYDGDKVVDEVMVLVLKSPNTYTREDTVEIDCHGGTLVLTRILETVIKFGARLAEPGEFTKRAFLNGRIDLSQAESVIDVINAQNDFALESSLRQLQGTVKQEVQKIRGKLIHEIAFIESALDDPEHISMEGYGDRLLGIVEDLSGQISSLVSSSENGILLKEGINTVIIGKPNVGKSSLMNLLAGEERAIVTDIAGTTRDALREQINLNGITLNVVDTAGIRDTEDKVERIGVDRAKSYLGQADLVLFMVDSSACLDKDDEEILSLLSGKNDGKKVIVLLNKSDLGQAVTEDLVRAQMGQDGMGYPILTVSVKDGKGMEGLEQAIKEMFFHGELSLHNEIYITNVRQKSALQSALCSLSMVKQSIEDGMPEDFYSIDLTDACEELGNITGESVGEDLVNEIFSKFCMGK